jgi:hypothetical protein
LSGRVDTLEADPVTKTYVDDQDALALPKAGATVNTGSEVVYRFNNGVTIDSAQDLKLWSDSSVNIVPEEDYDINLNTQAAGKTKINGNAEVSGNLNVGGNFVGDGDFTCGKLVVENTGTFSSSILPDGGTLKALFEAIGDALLARKTSVDVDAADAALSGRLDTLEADPTTAAAVAAVQADVDQNETDGDAADAALSARLDTLEADPTTATAVAAVQADVDQNESDADAAIALKAPLADPTFTGDVSFGSLGRINPSGNELKFLNDTLSSGIVLGNKITLQSNTEVEVFGDLVIENGLTNAADDTAAAAAGVDVNQLYRNGSVVMIRVS